MRRAIAVLLLVALAQWETHSAEAAGQEAGAIIVLDSSFTTQDSFGASTKLQAASNSVLGSIDRVPGLKVGLVAFGHRKARTCSDFELLKATASAVNEDFLRIMGRLKPQGPAPVAQALDFAARTPGILEGRSTLILIASGPDTCQADPCAIAQLLGKERKLRIDVVALSSGQETRMNALKCVAARTGGTFTVVDDESGLDAALTASLSAAATRAAIGSFNTRVESGGWSTEATPAMGAMDGGAEVTSFVPTTTGGPSSAVSLSAVLTDTGPQLVSGITWRIFAAKDEAPDEAARPVATLTEPEPSIMLPEGDYLVNVAYGRAHETRRISVKAGTALAERFILNAGGLRLRAVTANGEEIPPKSVAFTIQSDERDALDERQTVIEKAPVDTIIRLNAGIYHVVSVYGDANAVVESDVSVEAGKLTEASVNHKAARITFRLVQQKGGEALADTVWRIYSPTGQLVKQTAGALPTHILAAGSYTVEAERGGERYTGSVEVKEDGQQFVELIIPQ
ncbi:MAG: hypothetical protein R3D33_03185 [Hyphomicrobiaceae bacterium]